MSKPSSINCVAIVFMDNFFPVSFSYSYFMVLKKARFSSDIYEDNEDGQPITRQRLAENNEPHHAEAVIINQWREFATWKTGCEQTEHKVLHIKKDRSQYHIELFVKNI